MKWESVGEMPCSIARSLAIVGDRWTLLILRNAFMRIRRFDDFQQQMGLTRHVLAERLARLVEAGVMNKVAYQDRPPRYEYRLTEMGKDLYPVLQALTVWGDKWHDKGEGAPLQYVHKHCGQHYTPTMTCSVCHEAVTAQDTLAMPGPGFNAERTE